MYNGATTGRQDAAELEAAYPTDAVKIIICNISVSGVVRTHPGVSETLYSTCIFRMGHRKER